MKKCRAEERLSQKFKMKIDIMNLDTDLCEMFTNVDGSIVLERRFIGKGNIG